MPLFLSIYTVVIETEVSIHAVAPCCPLWALKSEELVAREVVGAVARVPLSAVA